MLLFPYLQQKTKEAIQSLYHVSIEHDSITVQKTRKEFQGDVTLILFPFLKFSKKSLEQTGEEMGSYITSAINEVNGFTLVKGFLNLKIHDFFWIDFLNEANTSQAENNYPFGYSAPQSSGKTFMVEYSSPNTNKPLHLGHIRNNLLGYAVAEILKANGHKVIKANLINDRGIHICKSMLAWQKWGKGETPTSSQMKGDKLVGKYYVLFDQKYKEEVAQMIEDGLKEKEAKEKAPLLLEAHEMLRKWEANDADTKSLWTTMNQWVYDGFKTTYETLGVNFDKIYYESQTYLLGKYIVEEGIKKGILFQKEDGSVWCNLKEDGLDEKLLLRSDGTSVYMTQDIGTAVQRFQECDVNELIYVVGNEQNYHFDVLFLILKKLGYTWAKHCFHLSYGMVDLPTGKLKSREGTVVDADDMMNEMFETAKTTTEQLGKLDSIPEQDRNALYQTIGLGALKYFILKIEPGKRILFQPEESIDFNGNTGPFIQYTFTRIQSILRKAGDFPTDKDFKAIVLMDKERELLKVMYDFPVVVQEAGKQLNPALIANYVYELVKEYNHFYQHISILKAEEDAIRYFRIQLSQLTGNIIASAMALLGINVPERM